MLLAGIAIAGAFAGGYQLGHRPAPADVSNLRPPALAGLAPPEGTLPSTRGGLPAIQQQLGTPPQIVLPQAATAPAGAGPNRNAFGLEN
jgi:hypothetical protein